MRGVLVALRNAVLAVVAVALPTLLSIWLEQGGFVPLGAAWDRSELDLGVVRHPARAGLEEDEAGALRATHLWQRPTRGRRYRLGFAHGLEAVDALEAAHDALAQDFAYHELDDDRFSWSVPPGCPDPWGCVYARMLEENEAPLDALAARFRAHFASTDWDRAEAARWLLAFVQEIPYRLPTEHPFGVLPPAIVASRDWGDCDSKSLLLIALLERLGIGSALMISDAHAHAMVGIEVPTGRRDAFRRLGREYAWAETTAKLPLGFRAPRLRNPDDWRMVLRR